jgi:hypothetical protein
MVSKFIGSACAALLLFAGAADRGRFAKYKAVETYEVRPGILMMPTYTGDGQVCEIVIERHHYVGGVANLYTTIPREEVLKIVDELVPASERGPADTKLGDRPVSLYSGNSVTTVSDYANVSIDIVGQASSPGNAGDMVALIRWKNRKCQ